MKMMVLEVEIPAIYTADIDELREHKFEGQSESEFLLNIIGEPSVCRLRVETSGEKDSSVQEVWGHIIGARLGEPAAPNVDEAWLAKNGTELLRDEAACEWCDVELAGPEDGA